MAQHASLASRSRATTMPRRTVAAQTTPRTFHPARQAVPRSRVLTRWLPEQEAEKSGTVTAKRSIVLALDTSKESDMAVSWAVSNLVRGGDTVHILHIAPGTHEHEWSAPPGHVPPGYSSGLQEAQQAQGMRAQGAHLAHQLVDRYGTYLAGKQATVHAHVLPLMRSASKSAIGQVLCEQAEQLDASALVIASTSRGGLPELLLGSVTDYTVQHCRRPVVVLHGPPASGASVAGGAGTGRQLVVAVDSSEESLAACEWVLDHMYHPGDHLHLVHVVPVLPLSVPTTGSDFLLAMGLEGDPDVVNRTTQLAEQEARAWEGQEAERFKQLMEQAGVPYTTDVMVQYTDSPVDTIAGSICSKAGELNAAAVVLSHHTRSRLVRLFTGSVAGTVTRHCEAPVVVLHAPQTPRVAMTGGPGASSTDKSAASAAL